VPLYEYECRECGKVTDIRHGFKETTNEACPACGSALVRRFNPAGIVFKGSGFYVTDSRKSSGTASESSSKSDAPAADAKSAPSPATSSGDAKSGSTDAGTSAPAKKSESAA